MIHPLLGELMVDYRLYILDRNGRIQTADWIVADNDEEAVELSRKDPRCACCELWKNRRLIAKFSNLAP